jgi:hypothetical protein
MLKKIFNDKINNICAEQSNIISKSQTLDMEPLIFFCYV